MTDERQKAELDRFEVRLMQASHLVATAQRNIIGAYVQGYMESAVNGAVMDLRAAASRIEQAQKDYAKAVSS